MSVTSYKFAGTAANVDRDSKAEWTNPDYAKADDTNYTVCVVNKDTYGDWLRLTNFGFSTSDIPSGSTINGIEIAIMKSTSYAGQSYIKDSALYLYNDGAVGSNLASAVAWSYKDVMAEVTYGGATNMCGTSLTQADIVANTFGIQLSALNIETSSNQNANVDYIKIRVYYTEGGGGSPVWLPFMKTRFIPSLIGGY